MAATNGTRRDEMRSLVRHTKQRLAREAALRPIDYDKPPPWLNQLVDPMDDEGFVHISPDPGLGYDINWEYINSNLLD